MSTSTAISRPPSTPSAQTVINPPSAASTPGTWRHPRLEEITRRQNAATFSEQNVRLIQWNLAVLVSSFILTTVITRYLTILLPLLRHTYSFYVLWALRILLLTNIGLALRPLWAKKDDLSDIPLTPTQRSLLGLAPSSAPTTPGGTYITPPRMPRSPASLNSSGRATRGESPHSAGAFSGSLFGGSMNGGSSSDLQGGRRSLNGSPFSPNASPLVRKAMDGRRSSLGRESPFGFSTSSAGFGDSMLEGLEFSGPKGVSTGKASVSLNSKWLYERGRGSSMGQRGLFS